MRVLRAANVSNNRTGGMSRTMYCTGDILAARGHRVEYLFADTIKAAGGPQWHRFTAPWRILQIVRERARAGEHYDLVELHEPAAALYCRMRKRLRLPPVAIFSYGLEERMHPATLAYFQKKGLPLSLKARYSPLSVVWQGRDAVRRAEHVICSNQEDVDHLKKAARIADARLTLHFSGTDRPYLEAGERAAQRERRGMLFLATWIVRKGILDLVPATTQALRRFPTETLTVAGCGIAKESVLASFPEDVRGRVEVIEHLRSDEELIALYARHAIFVLPSFFEGYPLALAEAAAMGLAPVTTGVCGMRDFVEDGKTGLLAPVGDPVALAAHLESLLEDPDRARALGEAARAKAATLPWEKTSERIERAWQAAAEAGARH